MTKRTLTSSISKQKEESPLLSKPGELILYFGQAQLLLNLLAQIPAKGAVAVHKTRLIANISPQIQEWGKFHQDLIAEHALTEPVDSSEPEGEKRVVRYSAADQLAGTIPEGEVVGAAKFATPEARLAFIVAFDALIKELPITVNVANTSLKKALTVMHDALTGDLCPLIDEQVLFTFERIVEEIETALNLTA